MNKIWSCLIYIKLYYPVYGTFITVLLHFAFLNCSKSLLLLSVFQTDQLQNVIIFVISWKKNSKMYLKVSKSRKKIMAPWILPKKRNRKKLTVLSTFSSSLSTQDSELRLLFQNFAKSPPQILLALHHIRRFQEYFNHINILISSFTWPWLNNDQKSLDLY